MASQDTTSEPNPPAEPVPTDPGPASAGRNTAEPGAVEPAGPAAADGGVGVPYHGLNVAKRRRWWRLAVPLVVFVMVQGVLVAAVALGSLLPERGIPVLGRHTQLAVLFAGIAACLPFLALYMWGSGRPFGQLSSVAGRLRRNWLAVCLCVTVTPFLAMAVMSVVLRRQDWTGWSTFVPTVAVMLVLAVFHAATEEYVCRGFVLQTVGSLFANPWPGIVVQALLYTALLGVGTVPGMIDVFVYAVMLGWLTVRTGGLEAAIAVHVGQSLMGVIVDVATLPAEVTQAATDKTIADAPWLAALIHLVLIGIFVSFLDRLAVWAPIPRRTTDHCAGQTVGQVAA
jgi:membrane protease YdiL (CAAX protease family)